MPSPLIWYKLFPLLVWKFKISVAALPAKVYVTADKLDVKLLLPKLVSFVENKVDTLIVSLDGSDQKTYSSYRIGGNFDTVISNIRKLIKIKND